MTTFLLMRHAEPDFSGPRKWNTRGWGRDLAPLTIRGEQQVLQQLEKIQDFDPEIVLSSPATRALQSALVLRGKVLVTFKVEFDLHEWVCDRSFQWSNLEEVQALQKDFTDNNGEWPIGETRPWETITCMRSRSLTVFQKYINYQRVLTICHGQLIRAITGVSQIEFAGLVTFEMKK